jgi:DNA-binding HxlR family transcriptional regulator
MKKTSERGMGKIQANTKMENRRKIINLLSDNQPHEYKEIKEKTNISGVTLSQHLKELKPLLERKEDKSAYPHRVSYKVNPIFKLELERQKTVETSWKEIRENFLQKDNLTNRDLLNALEGINGITNGLLAIILDDLIGSKDLKKDSEMVYLLLETFVWESYKDLTLRLFEEMQKKLMES